MRGLERNMDCASHDDGPQGRVHDIEDLELCVRSQRAARVQRKGYWTGLVSGM